ncbi:DUF6584 family protein [Nocardioides sp. CPCC 206347]|uniref:DUF6584 family protein n=1 Tax=unclassified Nocardioides TaxID=2615069 RepID=UPI00361B529C
MTNALVRARADLEAGRAWKARDRLTGLLVNRQDDEVLDLLASVHNEMGNLPAAGALWFVTGRDDPVALAAVDAWRERFGDETARLASIPSALRDTARVQALRREAAVRPRGSRDLPAPESDAQRWTGRVGCAVVLLIGLWLLAAVVVGSIAIVRAILG